MIGNDIVDLQLAKLQNRWQRPGWLQKIFTDAEIDDIQSSVNPDHKVWKFWSMKEAAYKAHQRRFLLAPTLNPKSFECDIQNEKCDTVRITSYSYKTNTKITEHYIYTIASALRKKTISKIFENNIELRAYLQQEWAARLHIDPKHITFHKNKYGIPMAYIHQKEANISFSLTHHGAYCGAIFQVPDVIHTYKC